MEGITLFQAILIAAYVVAFIIAVAGAQSKEIGPLWAFTVSLFASPVIGIVCVAMSKTVKESHDDYISLDYRVKAAEKLSQLSLSPFWQAIENEETIQQLVKQINEPPENIFTHMVFRHPDSSQKTITFKRYDEVKNSEYYKQTKLIGYKTEND